MVSSKYMKTMEFIDPVDSHKTKINIWNFLHYHGLIKSLLTITICYEYESKIGLFHMVVDRLK